MKTDLCEWAEQVAEAMFLEAPVSEEERAFAERHFEQCSLCRVWRMLRYEDGEATSALLPPLDDLSRRRKVDELLARVAGSTAVPPVSRGLRNRRWRLAALAGTCCAAAAAAVLVWMASGSPSHRTTPSTIQGVVALVSHVPRPGGEQLEVLHPIEEGDVLALEGAVVQLGDRVGVYLGDGQVRVTRLVLGRTELFLERGELTAYVDPEAKQHLTVRTPHGRLRVIGTVFAVRTDARGTSAEVLRGDVEVDPQDRPTRLVYPGQSLDWARGIATTLSSENLAELEQHFQLIESVLSPHRATLTVRTVPSGAKITVDDVEIGRAPLSVRLRPGFRVLQLDLDGFAPVREHIRVRRDEKLERMLALRAVPPSTPSPSEQGLEAALPPAHAVRPTARTRRPTDLPNGNTQPSLEESAPEPPPPSEGTADENAAALLGRAHEHRKRSRWADAARTYRKLRERFPQSPEGHAALLSLADIELEHLRQPTEALQHYDAYLERGGHLVQEALYGRIQALRALGRQEATEQAIREFVERFPNSIQAIQLRRSLRP